MKRKNEPTSLKLTRNFSEYFLKTTCPVIPAVHGPRMRTSSGDTEKNKNARACPKKCGERVIKWDRIRPWTYHGIYILGVVEKKKDISSGA